MSPPDAIILVAIPAAPFIWKQRRPSGTAQSQRFQFPDKIFLTDLLWISFFYWMLMCLSATDLQKKYWEYALMQIAIFIALIVCDWVLLSNFWQEGSTNWSLRYYLWFSLICSRWRPARHFNWSATKWKPTGWQKKRKREPENRTILSSFAGEPAFHVQRAEQYGGTGKKKIRCAGAFIDKLSSLMRYMLYEADEEKVPLKKKQNTCRAI